MIVKTDITDGFIFLIPLKNGEYKFFPYYIDIAYEYIESVKELKEKEREFCGAV
jgi:hypothetical protein